MGALKGKTAIVTGGSLGFGRALAKELLLEGAQVSICGRDAASLEEAQQELRAADSGSASRLLVERADVTSSDDMKRLVASTVQKFGSRVDVLVNNAGIYGPKGDLEENDWAQWVKTVEINLYGSILITREVLPLMKAAKKGKIIQVSGGGATQPMPRFTAYAASKAAVARFAESLAGEVKEHGIDVNSVALGALNTRFLDEVLAAGPEKVGEAFYKRSLQQKESGGAPMDRGIALCKFLASDESDGVTGRLISALWDNWEEFPKHLAELAPTDVFTIRRIVGKDRGQSWADK